MKKNTFILVLSVIGLFLECSMPSLSGTTSSENAKILGIILNESGEGVSNAQVKLIPAGFNPVIDGSLSDAFIDTTDTKGVYRFMRAAAGTYNVLANDPDSNRKLIHPHIYVPEKDTVVLPGDTLHKTGILQCNFPKTIVKNGYIYIEGTDIFSKLSDGVDLDNYKYSVTNPSVPAGTMPRILWSDQETIRLISDSTVVYVTDTTVLEVIDSLHPLWRFSCVVGISVKTVQKFKGMDSIKVLIKNQVEQAVKKFNNSDLLHGVLNFSVDSFYQFDGDVTAEINTPLKKFDYRLIYYSDTQDRLSSYFTEPRTMFQAEGGIRLFSQSSTDVLAWGMGMARGGIGLEWLVVRAKSNPVNQQDYPGATSFMNWPYGQNTLDQYTARVINYYADSVYYGGNFVNRSFPKNITITVRDTLGAPMAGVSVKLYGIRWKTFAVDTPAILNNLTDSNGVFVISKNPFNPDNAALARYLNLLVTASNGNEVAYTWLPVTDMVHTWLADPQGVCQVLVQFKGDRNK